MGRTLGLARNRETKEQEEEDALKRLEDALFCDDLDTSSSDDSSTAM
jgi:hypothetical protein